MKRSAWTSWIFALLLATIPGTPLRADTVRLKDGRSLEGTVIRRDGFVTVRSGGGELYQFPEGEIEGTQAGSTLVEAAQGEPLPQIEMKTNFGTVKLELFEDDAPNTVANFVELTEKGFFAGTKFHRVIPRFMIQGGDPNSKDDNPGDDGTGGPGYRFRDEISSKKHTGPGILSMANSGPNTNGSQFFVTLVPTPHLDGRHAVFGRVVEGLDVITAIGATPTSGPGGSPPDRPKKDVVIESMTVLRKRAHPYQVKKL